MVYLFVLLLWLSSAGRYLFSPAVGGLYFLLFLSMTPRYIGIGIGSEGFALTAIRAITFTIFLVIVVKNFARPNFNQLLIPDIKPFFLVTIVGYLVSIIGVVQHGSIIYGVIYFAEDIATLIVSLYVAWHIAARKDGLKVLVLYAFLIPGLFSGLLALIEFIRQAPVLESLISIDTSIATNRDFLYSNSFRGNSYRAKALFDGALQLAEFATYGFAAFVWCYFFKFFPRKISLLLLAVFSFIIFATGTRSSLIIVFISGISVLTAYFMQFGQKDFGRHVTWVALASGISVALIGVIVLLGNVEYNPTLYLIEDDRQRSTVARLIQYRLAPELVLGSPFYGFGYQRNFVEAFDVLPALDNYYLRILLQSGYVGLCLILIGIFLLFKTIIKLVFSKQRQIATLGVFGFGVLLTFVLFKFFISGETNNAYIYIVFFFIAFRIKFMRAS